MGERKTKSELMKEIEDLKKELEKCKRYEQYSEAANEVKVLYDIFVDVGFTASQAFTLVSELLANALRH